MSTTENSNFEIVNISYREGVTPVSKQPIFYVGVVAKVSAFNERYRRNQDMFVKYWATIGPDTKTLRFLHDAIPSFKRDSQVARMKKKFPNPDIQKVVDATGIDVVDHFNAYHSYLIMIDWYNEQHSKGYY